MDEDSLKIDNKLATLQALLNLLPTTIHGYLLTIYKQVEPNVWRIAYAQGEDELVYFKGDISNVAKEMLYWLNENKYL